MNLNELFNNRKKVLKEGGNASSHKDDGTPTPGWQGVPGQHQAQELDLNVHNRTYVVDVLSDLLHKINDLFAQQFKEPLWHENSVAAQKFLSGSTLRFFDKKISDEEFLRVKPKVGDIDTQAPDKHAETIKKFLTGLIGKQVGNAKFMGFGPGNNQYISIWEILLKDLPVKIQVDFEYGAHDPETGLPTEWQEYSHSSSWEDLSAGIKGVFHKYIDRALPYAANVTTKYVARVLKTGTKISDEPVTDSDYSFAVSGQGGGGVSRKYIPYNDPNTGEPMEKNGVPVMQLLPTGNRQYIQNLSQQFEIFFGKKPTAQDQQLKNSFIGTVQLANKYLDDAERTELFKRFVNICFEPGTQMITKGDPVRDRNTKMAAIDYMVENMSLPNAQALRKQAIQTAIEYEQAFTAKKTAKAPAPLAEAEVKAQFRKNMPHLRDLKPIDFLDLLDEIHDGNGNFKLQNIPLNVKIDGFGGRFGKDAEGKPFMATSNTPPRYKAGFVQYHQDKGTTDPEILGRAEKFDELFNEMMNAIKLVDSKLGADFLVNKQVTCEVLFLPFASETSEGKLKFVGIQYDKFPPGVELVLVPFRVVDASSGEDVPDANDVVTSLSKLGGQGSVRFVSNSLVQQDGLDVTEIINPLDNIEELKQIVSDTAGKRDRASLQLRREVEEKLMPVKIALEKAIDSDPNIIGKDILGQDYEGIVINSRLGPIKVTSQKQKDIITQKNAAKAAARAEQPRGGNKTAVVAIGSFVGHKGHQQLFGLTIDKAKEVSGDPYLFMGSAVGADDPIPVADKIKTWKQLYPEYAGNIDAVTQEGGSLMQKIKHELINPLPGKPPRYDNVIIMVGEDQAKMPIAQALMKAVNKFPGYEHVKVSLHPTPRGTGMSFTKLRNVLKTGNEQEAFQMWNDAFNGGQDGAKTLPAEWIKHLMDVSRTGMGVQQKPAMQQPAPQPVQQPALSEMRLFNALMLNENFADGRNPQDKGDSKRHGVPTKASVSTLRKVAKQGGRKGQLAHWMANMKAGKAKKNEDFNGEYDDEAGMAQSNLRTMARAVDGLLKTIKNNDNLPEWGQEKIAKAEMMLVSVWDYLQSQKELGMDPKVNESRALAGLKQIVAELSSEKLGRYKKTTEANVKTPQSYNRPRWWDDLPAKERDQFFRGQGNPKSSSEPKKKEKNVAEAYGPWGKKSPADLEKIKRALAKEKKQAPGQLRKSSSDTKKYSSGQSGEYFSKFTETDSAALAQTANRLTDPKDGAVAKLRAAGDKRREAELKGRDIAKRNEAMLPTSAFAGSDKNKLAPQGQLKGTAPKEQPKHKLVGETDKKKGADGKACWKNFKYAGTKNGKDKCVPIGEAYEAEMAAAILKLVEGKI
jgi:hypothetical protein